jgi:hypothetical protein
MIARCDRNRSRSNDQKKEAIENHCEGREKGSQEGSEEGKTIQYKRRQVGRFSYLTAFVFLRGVARYQGLSLRVDP